MLIRVSRDGTDLPLIEKIQSLRQLHIIYYMGEVPTL